MEGDAPNVKDGVGDNEGVELPLTVLLAVMDEVSVPVCVGVGLDVGDCVIVAVVEEDKEKVGVMEGEAPNVRDAVGDNESVELPLTVLLGVIEEVSVPVCVGVGLEVEDGVIDAEVDED